MQSQNHAIAFTRTNDIAVANVRYTMLLQTGKHGNGFNGSYKYYGTSIMDARATAFMGPGPCASSLIPCTQPSISVSLPSGPGCSNRLQTQTFYQTDRDTKNETAPKLVRIWGPNAGSGLGFGSGQFPAWFGFGPSSGSGPVRGRVEPPQPVSIPPRSSSKVIHLTFPTVL
jgi:hypothetical protein